MDIASIRLLYKERQLTPSQLIRQIYSRIDAEGEYSVWISLVPEAQNLARAEELESIEDRERLPLFGIPFAIKDNIDFAGLPTTAGCPAFAYSPAETAPVVQKLLDAGAMLIGKTNMDQFATGLVGTRSPYGACSSVFSKAHISGGSSSGSAVAVAAGLVCFSLGTDTAGSGRIPAAFNQIVGMKPTRGALSTRGVVPACRTLDCVSIFAETCSDAETVFLTARGFDESDPYSRTSVPYQPSWTPYHFRFGVPGEDQREFFGDEASASLYRDAITRLTALGGEPVEIDFAPFRAAAELLYSGPWIAERLATLQPFLSSHGEQMDPSVRQIIAGAERFTAVDCFRAAYELERLRRVTARMWDSVDLLLLPTAPRTYTIAEVQADPVKLNSNLGFYTNFVNLLDLAAVAVPAGLKPDGLPFGVSVIAPAGSDLYLLSVADRLHRAAGGCIAASSRSLEATPPLESAAIEEGRMAIAVVGAHLEGQPLNWQLTQRRGRLVARTRTHPDYRLYVLPNSVPAKPGLVHQPGFGGTGVEIEVWSLPVETVGSFVALIPPPLAIGSIKMQDGGWVKGFLCEPCGIEGAREITSLRGWRNYLAQSSVHKDL